MKPEFGEPERARRPAWGTGNETLLDMAAGFARRVHNSDFRAERLELVARHESWTRQGAPDPEIVPGELWCSTTCHPRGQGFMAKIREYDGELRHLSTHWLDFPLESGNKGMEGLTGVSLGGEPYLLALCEGNRCRSGAAGREPGGGRGQVFGRRRDGWDHRATIRLPEALPFHDYSSVAVAGQRIAVLSQESAALWLGTLRTSAWEVADEGRVGLKP